MRPLTAQRRSLLRMVSLVAQKRTPPLFIRTNVPIPFKPFIGHLKNMCCLWLLHPAVGTYTSLRSLTIWRLTFLLAPCLYLLDREMKMCDKETEYKADVASICKMRMICIEMRIKTLPSIVTPRLNPKSKVKCSIILWGAREVKQNKFKSLNPTYTKLMAAKKKSM